MRRGEKMEREGGGRTCLVAGQTFGVMGGPTS